jgi:diguanylate cyclase (GGDEF)-like protein/PAS domain S-box-containing protein
LSGAALAISIVAQISPTFDAIERDQALDNLARVENALSRENDRIDGILSGYSSWSESYRFVRGGATEDYLRDNYGNAYLKTVFVDFVLIVDPKGRPLFRYGDADCPELIERLCAGARSGNTGSEKLFAISDLGVMLVASRAVTDDAGTAPPVGRIAFGRVLTDDVIAGIGADLRISASLTPTRDSSRYDSSKPLVSRDSSSIFAQMPLDSPGMGRVAMLRIGQVRHIAIQGRAAMLKLIALQGAISTALCALLYLLLRSVLILPLARMTKSAAGIAGTSAFELRLEEKGLREVRVLSSSFNALLERLSEDKARLEERVADRTENLRKVVEELRLMEEVFQHSFDGKLVTDHEGVIIRANPAVERITGYKPEELVGKKPSILKSKRHGPEFFADMWKDLREKGEWSGEIWNASKDRHPYPVWMSISAMPPREGTEGRYFAIFHDIAEEKRKDEIVRHHAYHDQLTGLPNRQALSDELGRAIRRAERRTAALGVFFMDLDRFKAVNDLFGHEVGDEVLRMTAERFREAARRGEFVARQGGDEFIVVMEDSGSPENALAFAQRLVDSVDEPYLIGGREHSLGLSVGVAIYPEHGDSVDALLQAADQAMYEAKAAGKDRVALFKPCLTKTGLKGASEEGLVREIIESRLLGVELVPIRDLASGETVGYEGRPFLRRDGLESPLPEEFAESAMELGLSARLDALVLDRALEAFAAERARSLPFLAIEFSASGILSDGFLDEALVRMDVSGIDPCDLVIYLAEKAIVELGADAEALVARLSALGLRFCVKDFGSDALSLSSLEGLGAYGLALDDIYIRNAPASASDADIVSSTIAIAKRLSLATIAQSSDNPAQLDFLRSCGCDMVVDIPLGQG